MCQTETAIKQRDRMTRRASVRRPDRTAHESAADEPSSETANGRPYQHPSHFEQTADVCRGERFLPAIGPGLIEDRQGNYFPNCMYRHLGGHDYGSFQRRLITGNPFNTRAGIETDQSGQQPEGHFAVEDEAAPGRDWRKSKLLYLQVVKVFVANIDGEDERILVFAHVNSYFFG